MEYDVYVDCLPEDTTEKQKAMILLNLAGTEAMQREKSFVYRPAQAAVAAQGDQPAMPAIPAESRYSVEVLKSKFEELCAPQRNIIMERHAFNTRRQLPGESFSTFHAELRVLASTCAFGDLHDDLIRDRIVTGILDDRVRKQLLKEPDLNLRRAVTICQVAEQTDQSMDALSALTVKTDAITAKSDQKTEKKKQKCEYCGYFHRSPKPDACPAKGATCNTCGRKNHFSSVCRSHRVSTVIVPDADSAFLGSVQEEPKSCQDQVPEWRTKIAVQGKSISFKIDSGADVSVISNETYQSLKNPPELQCLPTPTLISPGGPVQCLGSFTAETHLKDKTYKFRVFVAKEPTESLLSRGAATSMGLIARLDSATIPAKFGCLKTETAKIMLKSDATPYSLNVSRRIPIPLEHKVKDELQRLTDAGIIEPVTKPTEWCAPMVPVLKKSGQVRICVDLKRLNAAVKRERYILPTIEDVTSKLSGAAMFSCLDAASGFYQIPLHEESQELTTFITPFGRYCFKRLPFGITSAPEIFMRKMMQTLEGLTGVFCYMDDILVFGKDKAHHDRNLKEALQRLQEAGLKLNPQKCVYSQSEVTFLGHIFSKDGVRPDPLKVKAITEMKPPTSVEQLRQFLGMIHYLGSYLPNLHTVVEPLNSLLCKDVAWIWDHSQQEAFEEVKRMVTQSPTLVFFDVTRPTRVSADASSYGLGGALLQQHEDQWKPVAFCSRTLASAERNYAQIEKECLASVWACEKFSRYLCGLDNISLITDHKPLVPLINTRDLSDVPIRCQRLLMRLMNFSVNAEYHPGCTLTIADTLSRIPVSVESNAEQVEDVHCFVGSVIEAFPATPRRLEEIRTETEKDDVLSRAIDLTLRGWPKRQRNVLDDLVPFFKQKGSLSVIDGLLSFGSRIVIPEALQNDILDKLHEGHLGIVKTLDRAKSAVWWPKMTDDIRARVGQCQHCQSLAPAQRKEPLMTTPLPEGPWMKLASDIFTLDNRHYLVVVDYYSRWLEVMPLSSQTSQSVIDRLKTVFSKFGLPTSMVTDNGPCYSSQLFKDFMRNHEISHVTTSPYFPSANGAAERAVQTGKKILRQKDPWLGLLAYRSTPVQATGYSPSQLLMGRRLRTTLPCLSETLTPEWPSPETVKKKDREAKAEYAYQYNRRHGARLLSPLPDGSRVAVSTEKGWTTSATVTGRAGTPRSMIVTTDSGADTRRNRRHLKALPETPSTPSLPLPISMEPDARSTPPSPPPALSPASPSVGSPSRVTLPPASQQHVVTRSGRVVVPPQRFDL